MTLMPMPLALAFVLLALFYVALAQIHTTEALEELSPKHPTACLF